MIILKEVKHYPATNSVEVTWVDQLEPARDFPETKAPDAISLITGAVIPGEITPAYTQPAIEVPVRCHSYADVQMDMLRADLGDDVSRYEELIALVVLGINTEEPELSVVKPAFIAQVDADADAIYAAALGNRETEYKQAEAEANAFRAAGYGGDVPIYVQAWASAKGASAQWAADDILATASAWRAAQAQIRTNRLACKEAARSATTAEELAPVVAQWNAFVAAITAQLRTS